MRNDPSIPDSARLLRKIHPDWIVPDLNTKTKRVSSQAFCNSPGEDGMSVYLESALISANREPQSVLVGFDMDSLVAITAGWARSLAQGVIRDPIPEEAAHAQVIGEKGANTRKKLAKQYEWVVGPK
jgi:hypothetical protein